MTDSLSPQTVNHADESMKAEPGASCVRVTLLGADCRLLATVALAVSVMSAFYAFEAGRQTAQATYWLQRNEAFLEQIASQGVNVPGDLLHKKDGK